MSLTSKSSILLPLYIYPDSGAWDPLHSAICANPNLNFIIIVNPNSGPGSPPWWPNADYIREIPRLNAQPNACTVGYVRTTYCRRPIQEVLRDIATYADWSKDFSINGLGVNGIFFDETPNVYSEEVKTYLDSITEAVKSDTGIRGERIVIHNPGSAVDHRLANVGPDITAVVEDAYCAFETEVYQEWLSTSPYNRERSCYMVHSVPVEKVKCLVYGLRKRAGYLFVTDLDTNYYQNFGLSWKCFVEAMVVE